MIIIIILVHDSQRLQNTIDCFYQRILKKLFVTQKRTSDIVTVISKSS